MTTPLMLLLSMLWVMRRMVLAWSGAGGGACLLCSLCEWRGLEGGRGMRTAGTQASKPQGAHGRKHTQRPTRVARYRCTRRAGNGMTSWVAGRTIWGGGGEKGGRNNWRARRHPHLRAHHEASRRHLASLLVGNATVGLALVRPAMPSIQSMPSPTPATASMAPAMDGSEGGNDAMPPSAHTHAHGSRAVLTDPLPLPSLQPQAVGLLLRGTDTHRQSWPRYVLVIGPEGCSFVRLGRGGWRRTRRRHEPQA